MSEKDEINIAKHTFVSCWANIPAFETLESPAVIIYNCVLLAVKHTPLLKITPGFFPEFFCDGEIENGLEIYKEQCRKFYSSLDEDSVFSKMSLNQGDLYMTPCARIAGEWIDTKLDSSWSFARIPASHVVVLTPETSITHDTKAILMYESIVRDVK